MTSVRLHSVESSKSGYTPYLVLKVNSSGIVSLVFPDLEPIQIQDLEVQIASSEIYRILEGYPSRILGDAAVVEISVDRDQICVLVTPPSLASSVEIRLWLTEMAVAWNLLCGP